MEHDKGGEVQVPHQGLSRLNPTAFLQTLLSQSIEVSEKLGCSHCNNPLNYIEQLGFGASKCFEEAYRCEHALEGPLDHNAYADLIVSIKNRIGGNFSRASSEPGVVCVINTQCPFGDAVKQVPELCQMTSSVFGGIAARNFGYAKVALAKRIAVNDATCEVYIVTDPAKALKYQGDEYHHQQGLIVGRAAFSEIGKRIQAKLYKAWCAPKEGAARIEQSCPTIIAESEVMRTVLETVEIVAPTSASVLITGETGVGKEVVARAIHAMSERRNKLFVAVNCGAIPESLLESALFGHERGAFTGAHEVHHGFFERAEKGTIFLDEIDSLPLSAQVRLLRVLQDGEFERVGGKQTLSADVRVIAAGSDRLIRLIKQGVFREDLYYRLNVVPISIAPLRDRREDVPSLINHILGKLRKKYGRKVDGLSQRAMLQALSYEWPGNVRELENVLERSFLFTTGQDIPQLQIQNMGEGDKPPASPEGVTLKTARKRAAEKVEAALLSEALVRFGGNIAAVAKFLQLTTRAVHQKLHTHQLDAARFRSKRNGRNEMI
jgi:DNA-binding NtrC family response regulator